MMKKSSDIKNCIGLMVILMFIGSEANQAQMVTHSDNYILLKTVSGSGGVLNSSGHAFVHSATAGEVFAGTMNNSNTKVFSGFWGQTTFMPTRVENVGASPTNGYLLHQNYPNPFRSATTITYTIPAESIVHVKIYNLAGQQVSYLVNSGNEGPGSIQKIWDGHFDNGDKASPGTYFYQITIYGHQSRTASNKILFQQTKKMVIVR